MNSICFGGCLVSDPIFEAGKIGAHDKAYSRLAHNRPGSNKVDYADFVCWGGTARALVDLCKKGKKLYLTGRLQTSNFQKEDGSWVNRFEINCSSITYGPDAKPKQAAPEVAPEVATPAATSNEATAVALQALQTLLAQASVAVPTATNIATSTEEALIESAEDAPFGADPEKYDIPL